MDQRDLQWLLFSARLHVIETSVVRLEVLLHALLPPEGHHGFAEAIVQAKATVSALYELRAQGADSAALTGSVGFQPSAAERAMLADEMREHFEAQQRTIDALF